MLLSKLQTLASQQKFVKRMRKSLCIRYISALLDCRSLFYVLRHAAKCDDMVIRISVCPIDDKLLKELADTLSNANGKLQVRNYPRAD